MGHPRVLWYHLIVTAYGFWLPNDPRGSWSEFVGSWELLEFGPATKTTERRSLANDPHDRAQRLSAKQALKYPSVRFDTDQRHAIASGFGQASREGAYVINACCIGYDHAHLIFARHERTIEQIATHLKSKATMALQRLSIHPLRQYTGPKGAVPTPWAKGIWSVFIDNEAHLRSAVAYVERHPHKEGLPNQRWDFVQAR